MPTVSLDQLQNAMEGAYRRFKDILERKDMLEKWHAYIDEQAAKALGKSCETESLSPWSLNLGLAM